MKKLLPYTVFVCCLFCLCFLSVAVASKENDCGPENICNRLKAEEAARREMLLRQSLSVPPHKKAARIKGKGPSVNPSYPQPPAPEASEKPKKAVSKPKTIKRHIVKNARPVTRIASIPVEIYPEKTVWVTLSNRDVNRIVCTTGDVEWVHFSDEKGIKVSIEGNEVYIKFRVLTNPQDPLGEVVRVTIPSEFFVRCGGETYSFIGKPRDVSARTIYLVSTAARIREAVDSFKRSDLDRAIVSIIKPVMRDEIPPSWEAVKKFVPSKMWLVLNGPNGKDVPVEIVEKKRYTIPGLSILVRIFAVGNPDAQNVVQVNEGVFLDGTFLTNPVAISILDHTLPPKLTTRAVVIERLTGNGL